MHGAGELLDVSLRDFLDSVASQDPTPGGGSAAALAVAMSAGLSAMVARASEGWGDARAATVQADRIRRRVAPLAQLDAEAYEEALASMRLPQRLEPAVREAALRGALERSVEAPLQIADAAADAACLAAELAEHGAPGRRGDAVAAALLAEAAARIAAALIEVNLTVVPNDPRVEQARNLAETARQAARRAASSTGP